MVEKKKKSTNKIEAGVMKIKIVPKKKILKKKVVRKKISKPHSKKKIVRRVARKKGVFDLIFSRKKKVVVRKHKDKYQKRKKVSEKSSLKSYSKKKQEVRKKLDMKRKQETKKKQKAKEKIEMKRKQEMKNKQEAKKIKEKKEQKSKKKMDIKKKAVEAKRMEIKKQEEKKKLEMKRKQEMKKKQEVKKIKEKKEQESKKKIDMIRKQEMKSKAVEAKRMEIKKQEETKRKQDVNKKEEKSDNTKDIEKAIALPSRLTKKGAISQEYIKTGVAGFDGLLKEGIPSGASVLVEGGPGSGKTIFCLEVAKKMCAQGKKVLYMSFEEPEYRLRTHLKQFGMNVDKYEKQGLLYIKRFNALDIARSVEALLSEAKKELLIDVQPVLIPKDFSPDVILVDSLTSIGSAFSGEESRFRIYMEQLFRYLESHQITSFLIRETNNPTHIGTSFVEKAEAVSFLSDGIISMYNVFMSSGKRKRALEIIKMRGVHIERKIVECEIKGGRGLVIYPNKVLKGRYKLT